MVIYGLIAFIGFSTLSIVYVYNLRGQVRYVNFTEYVRKGWPLFTPFNTFLYMFTQKRARKAIMDMKDFPELDPIKNNWKVIQEEVLNLYNESYFDATKKPGSAAYYDLGFRTFYKYGWSKFYLKWYGYTHPSAQRLCPKTLEILKDIPSVNGAMFSLLPVGSQLTRHLDPIACSLRYHLGLSTPNSEDCFINVDGSPYYWQDGEAFVFDETFMHFAKNNADKPRLILMCDIERPTHTLGSLFNALYKNLAKLTVVPNTGEDKQGFVNLMFSGLSPTIQKIKSLKQSNKRLYFFVKHGINLFLLILVLGILAGALSLVSFLL